MQNRSASSGFTLIELLVVVGILSLLMTVLITAFGPTREHLEQSVDKFALAKRYLLFEIARQRRTGGLFKRVRELEARIARLEGESS